jgi:hypothetical protein
MSDEKPKIPFIQVNDVIREMTDEEYSDYSKLIASVDVIIEPKEEASE